MSEKKKIIAFVYDFDKTLSTYDMQEFGFMDAVKTNPKTFWDICKEFSNKNKMDPILAYMYKMLTESRKNEQKISRDVIKKYGETVELYNGVEDWFKNINSYCVNKGLEPRHYIISSGLKEMIEGTSIYENFHNVFACEFYYDENGVALWPRQIVNYTSKTQYIFRINKGIEDVNDNEHINDYIPYEDRPVPFENMIYIGDGSSDVPCMKLVKEKGGTSIAVYGKNRDCANKLMRDGRVNFIAKANYATTGELYKIAMLTVDKISADCSYRSKTNKCKIKSNV